MAELAAKDEARLKQKLVPEERRALKERLRGFDNDELVAEVQRLESLASHQAYKAASSDDVAKHGLLQRRQDELAVAREVLLGRSASTDDDSIGAALRIQCQIRRCLARLETRRRRIKRDVAMKDRRDEDEKGESALLIQGQMRRKLARKELDRRKERRAQGLDPTRDGEEADRRPVSSYGPRDCATPQPKEGAGAEVALSEGGLSGARSIGLDPSHQALVPGFTIQDVSDVPITDDELRVQFDRIDQNGNGWIDKKEFTVFYRELESFGMEESDEELADLLSRYKMLGDDRLSFDEFAIIMLKLAQR